MVYSLKKGPKEAYHFVVLRNIPSLGHWKESALKVSVIEGSVSPQLPAPALCRHRSEQHHLTSHSHSLLPAAGCSLLWDILCWWWATCIFVLFESLEGL